MNAAADETGKRVPVVVEGVDDRSPTDSPDVAIDLGRWIKLARRSLETEGADGSLGLIFVDATEIAVLNEQYLGKSGPTDVLSFPIDGVDVEPSDSRVPTLLGDVIVSPAVAAAQYLGHAGTLDDELALLIVHGVLHVLGYDHTEPGETICMRNRERSLLEAHHWGHIAPARFSHDHIEP